MRNPSEIDDLQLEQPEESWVAGEMTLTEERPSTALRSDSSHRNWMLIGVGGCGLLTALAVFLLTQNPPAQAAGEPAIEPAPIEQPVEPEPAAVEPAAVEPAVAKQPKPREKPTLAASSRAAASGPAPIKKAPPTPVAPAAEPTSAPAAAKPTVPSKPASTPASKPTPAADPLLPADEPGSDTPAAELPDVEAWDEADAAVEQDEPAAEPDPAPSEVSS